MLTIFIALCIGIVIGYIQKKRPSFVRGADTCARWLVCLLLLSLGLSLGANDSILASFGMIGLNTVLICAGSTLGSAFAGLGVFRLFFRKDYAAEKATRRSAAKALQAVAKDAEKGVAKAVGNALKNCALLLLMFIAGFGLGLSKAQFVHMIPENLPELILHVLLLMVGISIGSAPQTWRSVSGMGLKIFLVPFAAAIGSMAGGIAISPLIPELSVPHILAVASGFGYYSLASIIISAKGLPVLGAISLLCNLLRELGVIMLIPLIFRFFGPLGAISAAGAASMDTILPFIARHTSSKYAILSIINGTILTILVPFLVPFVLGL